MGAGFTPKPKVKMQNVSFHSVEKDNKQKVLTYVFDSISVVIPIQKKIQKCFPFLKREKKKKVHIIFDL